MTSSSKLVTRGLDQMRERWALAGCLALALGYAATFAWMQLTGEPIDKRFFRLRTAFNIAALQSHPVVIGQPVAMSQAMHPAAQFALLSGWSVPEPWGVWTESKTAALAMVLPATRPPALTLAFAAAVSDTGQPDQVITISAASREIGRWVVRDTAEVELAAPIPADAIGPDGVLQISFSVAHLSRAASGKDPRMLGLGVQRFEVRDTATSRASTAIVAPATHNTP